MKKISISIITILIASNLITSCRKGFLERSPQGNLSEQVLANSKGVEALLVGAYGALDGQNVGGGTWESSPDNWIYGSVAGGDAHKGSDATDQPPIDLIARGTSDASNGFFNAKWKAAYEGISRCNAVLRVIQQVTDMSDADKNNTIGQARFLRGHYYFELKKMFNMVPWIDETTVDFKQPNTEDIWPKIEEDFKFAMQNTNEIQSDLGKVNKWAAAAYLGKVYMFEHKYPDAKGIFDQIEASGKTNNGLKYGLTDRYEDNFDPAVEHNKETVFNIEMVANDGTLSIANANAGDMLNFPYNSPFRCCGFYQPTQDLVNSYKTDPVTGLPLLDNYNDVPVKNDMGILSSAPFTPYTGTLDPRLDWTVGRRGIPFLDWGNHPGKNWIRDQDYSGPYAPKKNVYWQATQSTFSDGSSWAPGTAINIHVIRYADVLLLAAEAEVQAGSAAKALEYVNRVRTRAANPQTMVYKYTDDTKPMDGFTTTPAANYKVGAYPTGAFANKDYALKAIYFERKLELAMEGHRFFDLVRTGTAESALNNYFQYESKITIDVRGGKFTKGKNEYFPIPQGQIDLSVKDGQATLKQNPGYN